MMARPAVQLSLLDSRRWAKDGLNGDETFLMEQAGNVETVARLEEEKIALPDESLLGLTTRAEGKR